MPQHGPAPSTHGGARGGGSRRRWCTSGGGTCSQHRGGPHETDEVILRRLVENHFRHTGSFRARDLVSDWESARGKFVKIMPVDYKRALIEMYRAANPQSVAA